MITSATELLKISDFDFTLPETLIAQEPVAIRDRSRLMALDRKTGELEHRIFSDIESYLVSGDVLVLNDTKVFPCRLIAKKPGNGKAEVFLLEEKGLNVWDALVKGGAGLGKRVNVDQGIEAEIIAEREDGIKVVRFLGVPDIRAILPELGRTPLPPYIKREPGQKDRERYQTVYASREGAVAAPTAGLHFTGELFARLKAKGVELVHITLHVGPGTFQPVRVETITEHRMHPERYELSAGSAASINRAKTEGRRVIAVGTTSVRTLETAASSSAGVAPGEGSSALFIHPGYVFKVIDGMITNFHLPKSTLLMLVAAFVGRENILSAYLTAIQEKYRFYSYGDAMLIL